MLIYHRNDNGEHVWRTENDDPALWRGANGWYGVINNLTRRMAPLSWPDGDVLTLYRVLLRINHERICNGTKH